MKFQQVNSADELVGFLKAYAPILVDKKMKPPTYPSAVRIYDNGDGPQLDLVTVPEFNQSQQMQYAFVRGLNERPYEKE
jgi:hypothetical protein